MKKRDCFAAGFGVVFLTVALASPALAWESKMEEMLGAGRAPASSRPKTSKESGAEPAPAVKTDEAPFEGKKDFGLSGDWGGARARLDDKGVGFAFVYKGEANRVLSGGVERRSTYLNNLDLKAKVDAEKLLKWKGATFFLYGLGNWGADHGQKPSRYVGDLQGTSNIETTVDAFKLYEAWIEQRFADDRVSLLFGIHDLNSEFYSTDTSTLFFNATFGVGKELAQTGVQGPSIFPYTTTAARLKFETSDHFYLQTGVFNAKAGNPNAPSDWNFSLTSADGHLFINEAGHLGSDEHPHKYAIGYWTYTRTFDSPSENIQAADGSSIPKQVSNSGVYLMVDQSISKLVSAFARFGSASSVSNTVRNSFSAGFVGKGLIGFRPEDRLGLGVARITPAALKRSSEATYELTYRVECGRGVSLQPNFQYVQNPSFSETIQDAKVGAIRLEISL